MNGPSVSPWSAWADGERDAIHAAGRWREPRDLDAAGPEGKLGPDDLPVVSYASNDYLGLTQHPAVVAAAHAALDRWGAGAGAARLVVGSRPIHSELEAALAEWKRTEAAVLFPTGFAANLGTLATFGGPDVLVCSDELNHASIIDGCRAGRGEVAVYRHRDVDHLATLLAQRGGRRALVVTDTVFSMDGDVADVDALVALCDRERALLVLDEAHAVLGPDPGLPDPGLPDPGLPDPGLPDPGLHGPGLESPDVLRVGTLSKTLGALGGFVAGPRRYTELLVNRARSYVFTTASTPADTAAGLAALDIVRSPEGDALRARLRANVDTLRPGHPSPVIPVVLGDEDAALAASRSLLEAGLLVPAIRPPTVAPGTSRLRIAMSAAHTPGQVRALADALASL